MATHADILIADTSVQLADFGEPAVYYPAAGGSRPITVLVNRSAAQLTDKPRTQLDPLTIQAANSVTTGISSAEWTNRDEVSVARNYGGPTVRMRVTRCPAHDAGMTTLELTT